MITKRLASQVFGLAALASIALAGTAHAQYYYAPTASYPVYAAPAPQVVYNTAPVYYSQPVYAQPTYYAQPVYAQPVYAAPYYSSGYYSPIGIGLNFNFGGGRHWH